MTSPNLRKSVFECACQNLRSILRHMRYELAMPTDAIQIAVKGMLHPFDIDDLNRKANVVPPEPERPA